jgi:hypothetical protein
MDTPRERFWAVLVATLVVDAIALAFLMSQASAQHTQLPVTGVDVVILAPSTRVSALWGARCAACHDRGALDFRVRVEPPPRARMRSAILDGIERDGVFVMPANDDLDVRTVDALADLVVHLHATSSP